MVNAVAARAWESARSTDTGVDAKPVLRLVAGLAEIHVQPFESKGPGAGHRRFYSRPGNPPDARQPVVEGIVGVHLLPPVRSRVEIGERVGDSGNRRAASEEHAETAERFPNADARRPGPVQFRRRRFVQDESRVRVLPR